MQHVVLGHTYEFWTVIGVLLTAAFTGGLMFLGSFDALFRWREKQAAVAHSFALQRVQGVWVRPAPPGSGFLQVSLLFLNSHSDALRYEVEHVSLTIGDITSDEKQGFLSTSGVVPSGQLERFTIPELAIPERFVPLGGEVSFTIRYGRAARKHYEWRESGKVSIPVPSPSIGVGVLSELLYLRVGVTVTEKLKKP